MAVVHASVLAASEPCPVHESEVVQRIPNTRGPIVNMKATSKPMVHRIVVSFGAHCGEFGFLGERFEIGARRAR